MLLKQAECNYLFATLFLITSTINCCKNFYIQAPPSTPLRLQSSTIQAESKGAVFTEYSFATINTGCNGGSNSGSTDDSLETNAVNINSPVENTAIDLVTTTSTTNNFNQVAHTTELISSVEDTLIVVTPALIPTSFPIVKKIIIICSR